MSFKEISTTMISQKSLPRDLKLMLDNPSYSDIKIRGNDGGEINAHRVILAARSEVFKNKLNEMKGTSQDVIEFSKFSSRALRVVLEYLYSEEEKTLSIEIIAEAFHCADFFSLDQLKIQIIEFFKIFITSNIEIKSLRNISNVENKSLKNMTARILSQHLKYKKYKESSDNEFANFLCDSIKSVPLETIEYRNLNGKALKFILSKIKKEEEETWSTLEYDLFNYITLWAANKISKEALSFYKLCLPSSEDVKNLNTTYSQKWNFNLPANVREVHSKYQLKMTTKTSSLFNYVNFEQIHPLVISNVIEPFDDLINSKTLMDVYRKQSLLAGKYTSYISNNFLKREWDASACGKTMGLDKNLFVASSNSSKHEWIRTTVPISGQGLVEWDIVVEKLCSYLWVGICTEKGFDVDYNSWLGKQPYGWVLGSNGFLSHNEGVVGPYSNKYGHEFYENDRITVHLDMGKRTCSFSINGKKYGTAFHDLPDEIYPAVSLRAPGKVRIEGYYTRCSRCACCACCTC